MFKPEPHVLPQWRRSLRGFAATATLLVLGGCQWHAGSLAPAAPALPWTPHELPREQPLVLMPAPAAAAAVSSAEAGSKADYALPMLAQAGLMAEPPEVPVGQALSLAQLIDLAQRNSPLTRAAWEQARRAAIAVGMAESLFLPMISALVIGGQQRVTQPLPLAIGSLDQVRTTVRGVVPALTLQWLLFDFGEREAGVAAAKQLSFGANVQFQAAHQRVIQAVSLAYYQHDAARIRTRIAADSLANANAVLEAVEARRRQGVATVLEEAQARQQVAQARLRQVQAQGAERDSYQALIAAAGLPPDTRLEVAPLGERELPVALHAQTEEQVRAALAQRPDVLATYAAAQAAREGITAAEAAFAPKVFLTGSVAHIRDRMDVNGLSFVGQPLSTAGVLVGVSLPIYDGRLRERNLQAARSRADEAVALWRQAQEAAVLDVVMAGNALRTALEAHEAAAEWVRTAGVTYDAALDAYRHGVGTVTLATEAMSVLLTARMAETDARTAALAAAVNLAHATGRLTSSEQLP